VTYFRQYHPGICLQGVGKGRDAWYFRPRSRSANRLTGRYTRAVPETQHGLRGKLHYVSRRAHSLSLSVNAISQYGTSYTAQREGGHYDCLLGCGCKSYGDSYRGFGGTCCLSLQDRVGQKVAEISVDLGSFGSAAARMTYHRNV
jgi:hypothetical protein